MVARHARVRSREEFTLVEPNRKCMRAPHRSGGGRLGARGGLHAVQKHAIDRITGKWGRARGRAPHCMLGWDSLTRWCARMGVCVNWKLVWALRLKKSCDVIKIKVNKYLDFISLIAKSDCKKFILSSKNFCECETHQNSKRISACPASQKRRETTPHKSET